MTYQKKQSLLVFNIQKYSLHDGRGIRTVVFLKGCPLRCRWCCNPESQNRDIELMYRRTRCIGNKECGLCRDAAPEGCICFDEEGKAAVDFTRAGKNLDWTEVCPSGALKREGRWMDIEEILEAASADEVFYRGKGGLTLSGGEPLFQEETATLLSAAKKERLNTAIETTGYAPEDRLFAAAEFLDQIYYDVKSLDEEKHLQYTGISNKRILENLKALVREFPQKKICVRTPVIPGFNDDPGELERIEDFIKGIGITEWEKLPYHTYGVGKYEMPGREYRLSQDPEA